MSRTLHLLLAIPAGIFLILMLSPAASSSGSDASDTTPPTLQSLSLAPTAVDVTGGPATVTVTATITDDLSGVVDGATQMGIESPSNNQIAAGPLTRQAGDTYTASLTIPQHAEGGVWHLRYVTLKDNAGNTRALFESDLASAGFSASVQVTTEADTTPPVLSSLSLSPSSVDVSNGPAAVTATATVTDDLSGVLDGQTQTGIESPSTTQIAAGPLNHVNGDTYTAVLTISQNAEAGIWHLRYATLVDAAGNHRSLLREELGAAGFTATVTVLSAHADSSPPVLHSLSINPTAVDIATGPATITASAQRAFGSTRARVQVPGGFG